MSILSLLYGCQVWHLNDTNRSMHEISVAWNNCFRRIFYVAGGRVSNHYNIFAPHSQCRISFSSANCFFLEKKIYWSDNTVLLTLSRLTYNAFIAVGCTFDVLTPKLSDNAVKGLVWNLFAASV